MLCNLPFRVAIASTLVMSLGTGPTPLAAQQMPDDVPAITIRANTRLVVVDLVVTNKSGQPVTGLKPEDFTLEENGKKQKISVFVPPGAANRPATAPVPPGVLSNHPENVLPAGIPIVLLLDGLNSSFANQSYARSQMLKYVVEQAQSGHPMAVLTLTDRVHVLQEFTSDPQVLITAIKSLKPEEPILQPGAPPPESHGVASMDGVHSNFANAAVNQAMANAQGFEDLQLGYNLERRTLITLDALQELSRMLGGLPGRKNVVWLTASLPFDLIPEDRSVSDAELMADLPSVRQKSVGTTASGSLAGEQRAGWKVRPATRGLSTAQAHSATQPPLTFPACRLLMARWKKWPRRPAAKHTSIRTKSRTELCWPRPTKKPPTPLVIIPRTRSGTESCVISR
jgi:VWFA-related protein